MRRNPSTSKLNAMIGAGLGVPVARAPATRRRGSPGEGDQDDRAEGSWAPRPDLAQRPRCDPVERVGQRGERDHDDGQGDDASDAAEGLSEHEEHSRRVAKPRCAAGTPSAMLRQLAYRIRLACGSTPVCIFDLRGFISRLRQLP